MAQALTAAIGQPQEPLYPLQFAPSVVLSSPISISINSILPFHSSSNKESDFGDEETKARQGSETVVAKAKTDGMEGMVTD